MTPKILEMELWFVYTALFHNLTYLCMKFKITSFNTFEVTPKTRFRDARTDRQMDRQGYSSIPPKLRLWEILQPGSILTNHSRSFFDFSYKICKLECNTTSDWLNHMV